MSRSSSTLPSTPLPLVPHPRPATPSSSEALGNINLTRIRFINLCQNGQETEIEDLISQWQDPAAQLGHMASVRGLSGAAKHGHLLLLEKLIQRGFTFQHLLEVWDSAIEWAAESGDLKILDLLARLGWDPMANGRRLPSTALQSVSVVRWFIDRGADLNSRDDWGFTAIEYAATKSSITVIEFLLEHGASLAGKDVIGRASAGHNKGSPDRLEVVEYLLKKGAEVDVYCYANWTGFYYVTIVGLETGLQLAVRGGQKDMVELLLRNGADMNKRGGFLQSQISKGETALEIAKLKGFNDILNLLQRYSI